MTKDTESANLRKRPIRSFADVQAADPLALARMTRAQVDDLGEGASRLRVARMLNATDTMLGIPELMALFNVGRAAVQRWRWRRNAGDEITGQQIVLLDPDPGERRSANGVVGPHWSLARLLPWAAMHEICSRNDYVVFEKRRNRGGRTPEAVKAELGTPPSQQRRTIQEPSRGDAKVAA